MIGYLAVAAICAMRCAGCGQIMNQGERDRNQRTAEGRPIHDQCQLLLTIPLAKVSSPTTRDS